MWNVWETYIIQLSYPTHFKFKIHKNIQNLKKCRGWSCKSAAPNLKYYYLARVCTTSGKPSTRLPLERHVELKPRKSFWSPILQYFYYAYLQCVILLLMIHLSERRCGNNLKYWTAVRKRNLLLINSKFGQLFWTLWFLSSTKLFRIHSAVHLHSRFVHSIF